MRCAGVENIAFVVNERNSTPAPPVSNAMMLYRIGWKSAILIILCVLAIFFFPATLGPYSAVHGPVTALQAAQVAARLHLAMIHAALGSFGNSQIALLAWVNSPVVVYAESHSASFPDCGTTLRC